MKIIIINGPNLNLVGIRQPDIYGVKTFDDFYRELKTEFKTHELTYFQSNREGEIIDKIQETGFEYDGIVLNAGGFTHTSVAIADAVASVNSPVIEIHISNIYAREPFRHKSLISPYARAIVAGFGLDSYALAIKGILSWTS